MAGHEVSSRDSSITPTRGRLPRCLAVVVCLNACSEPADRSSADAPDTSTAPAAPPAVWETRKLEPGFRAFAWSGDSLWGIVRGRLALAIADTVVRMPQIAWDVHAAPGIASWTDEAGLHVSDASGTRTIARPDWIDSDYTGPAVLWSDDGSRAVLTWTGEAGARHSLLHRTDHTPLAARVPGYTTGDPLLWLDSTCVLLAITAFAPTSGPGGHREGGYRSDLAVHDVVADTMSRVTRFADSEFVVVEGRLHRDTVLIGVRSGDGTSMRHVALDIHSWRSSPRAGIEGRAAAHDGVVALLTPISATGPESRWALSLIERDVRQTVDTVAGYAVRLLWHPSQAMIAVSQDSELPQGYRTLLIRRRE